jgi:surfeit locus 1 family protein
MESAARRPRSAAVLAMLVGAGALLCALLLALGGWQVQRLGWKQALIERVERNVNAAPIAAPDPSASQALGAEDEYRRVRVGGRFDHQREVLVRASTELGSGYWVLTPLRTAQGWWLLVNRGFVPQSMRGQVPPAEGDQVIIGLLRSSEPQGTPLQSNDPAAGRWYSRDVAAIAAARGLQGPVAPYFVDAQPQGTEAASAWPRAGLTVIHFRNHHLVYAITWFILAAMVAAAIAYLMADERRLRRQQGAASLADDPSS